MIEVLIVATFLFNANACAVRSAHVDRCLHQDLQNCFGFLDKRAAKELKRAHLCRSVADMEFSRTKSGVGRKVNNFQTAIIQVRYRRAHY